MLGNFPALNSVEIVVRRGAISETALGHDEYEIAFPEHFVHSMIGTSVVESKNVPGRFSSPRFGLVPAFVGAGLVYGGSPTDAAWR